jgi:hypothetical protein
MTHLSSTSLAFPQPCTHTALPESRFQSFSVPSDDPSPFPVHPNGISRAAGVLIDGDDTGQAGDNGVLAILPKASGITRG